MKTEVNKRCFIKPSKLVSQSSHLNDACWINRNNFVQWQTQDLCFPMCKRQQCSSCMKDANAFFLFVSLMQKCVCQDSDEWQYLLKQQDHQVLTTSLQTGQTLWRIYWQDLDLSFFFTPWVKTTLPRQFSIAWLSFSSSCFRIFWLRFRNFSEH